MNTTGRILCFPYRPPPPHTRANAWVATVLKNALAKTREQNPPLQNLGIALRTVEK